MTREGGCLCGAVRYAAHGLLREVLVCHCVECRRFSGRAWPATASRTDELEIRHDPEVLAWIESPRSAQRASRAFCARCGSSLFYRAPASERTSISAGTLDDPSALRVAAHIWVEQALAWDPPPEDLPRYARGYPADAPPLAWS